MNQQMRQVLANLELISYGATASYNSSGSGKPGWKQPAPVGEVLHLKFRADYLAADTPERRQEVISEAQSALEALRRQTTHFEGETDAQKRKRCIKECEGMDACDAAAHMRETTRWVVKARIAESRDPNLGRPLFPSSPDWRTKARELRALGFSVRATARQVNKGKSYVDRVVRKAA